MADPQLYDDNEYYEDEGDEEGDEYEEGEEYDTEEGEEEVAVLEEEDDRDRAEEWQGRTALPNRTWESLTQLVGQLSEVGKTELTVLLLGKASVGKTSVANSLLCERVAEPNAGVSVAQAPRGVQIHVRTAGQFLLRVIDTPSLVQGDRVNVGVFKEIADAIAPRRVDVVLYVERLDVYRIDQLDRQVLRAVTQHFGSAVWKRAVVALTRGSCTPPAGYQWPPFAAKRSKLLQQAIRRAGGQADTPVVILENSARCTSNDGGEKVLPDGTVWMTSAMGAIVSVALALRKGVAIKYRTNNPNRHRLWLIPLLLLVQFAAKKYLFDPAVEADGWRGDRHGDYDAETQQQEKLLVETRKAEARRELEAQRKASKRASKAEQQRTAALATQASRSGFKNVAYEDDEDLDEDDDYE